MRDIPRAALPDCHTCPKPELHPGNVVVVSVYNLVQNQQTVSIMGHRMGLRIEAIKVAIDVLGEEGYDVSERVKLFQRVFLIDSVVNNIMNDRLDQNSKST